MKTIHSIDILKIFTSLAEAKLSAEQLQKEDMENIVLHGVKCFNEGKAAAYKEILKIHGFGERDIENKIEILTKDI